jgi:hypothetical protein
VRKKSTATLKPNEPPARINPLMRENEDAREAAMSDTLSAAVIGAIAGYLIARHSPEIEWLLHALIG